MVRGRNAFSVNRFKEYLVHEMHKQIRRDFLKATHNEAAESTGRQIQFGAGWKNIFTPADFYNYSKRPFLCSIFTCMFHVLGRCTVAFWPFACFVCCMI
jgi:hypothetical protein